MTFPEWAKPSFYGALADAIAVSFRGFTWSGWRTSGNAQTMVRDSALEDLTLAMVPVCLETSAADPEDAENPVLLNKFSGFGRRNPIIETGWTARPGRSVQGSGNPRIRIS